MQRNSVTKPLETLPPRPSLRPSPRSLSAEERLVRIAGSLLLMSAVLAGSYPLIAASKVLTFDLVVYGSTPSGIMAAVAAARSGLKVALVDKAQHVGGMVTSGLSYTDRGKTETIG